MIAVFCCNSLCVAKSTQSSSLDEQSWALLPRASCTRLHDGAEVAPEEELVIWVPTRLLLCSSKDADLAQHLTETLLRNGLFPAKVPLATAARQWAAIYMSSTAQVCHLGVCQPCISMASLLCTEISHACQILGVKCNWHMYRYFAICCTLL